jgi:hypothetical protein
LLEVLLPLFTFPEMYLQVIPISKASNKGFLEFVNKVNKMDKVNETDSKVEDTQ